MNATPAQETSDQRGASLVGTSGGFGGSVIKELMRLDKIVRACNSHAALVEALEFVRKWDDMHPDENRLPGQLRSAVRTALAAAKL